MQEWKMSADLIRCLMGSKQPLFKATVLENMKSKDFRKNIFPMSVLTGGVFTSSVDNHKKISGNNSRMNSLEK